MMSIAAHIAGTRLVAPRQTVAAVILSASDLKVCSAILTLIFVGRLLSLMISEVGRPASEDCRLLLADACASTLSERSSLAGSSIKVHVYGSCVALQRSAMCRLTATFGSAGAVN